MPLTIEQISEITNKYYKPTLSQRVEAILSRKFIDTYNKRAYAKALLTKKHDQVVRYHPPVNKETFRKLQKNIPQMERA